MARGIGPGQILAVVLFPIFLGVSVAHASDPRAMERFRAAAVLQERALYDLAAAEYAAIEREFAVDALADRAGLQRGVCLFQLSQFAEAEKELASLHARQPGLSPDEQQQLLAYFGLTEYNLSRTSDAARRDLLLDAAIAALAEHQDHFPASPLAPQTGFYHAEALYARGRLDAAVAAYRALLAKYPQHPQRADALYALGVAQQERGDHAGAIETLARFEQEFPQHAAHADAHARRGDASLALAESQFANHEPLPVRRTAEQLLTEFPESALVPSAFALVAQVQLDQSNLAAAESSLDQCLQRSTHAEVSTDARLLRARVRYERGNFAGSLADASAVLTHDPARIEAMHLSGRAQTSLGKPTEAIKSYQQILDSAPNYAHIDRVLYDLAWAYQAANESAAANATFVRLAESHPESQFAPECHFRVGESQYAAKNFVAAAKSYFQACDATQSPELLDKSIHKLAWCCFERHQFGAAEEAFDRQIALQAERIEAAGGKFDVATPLEPLAADAMWLIVECRFQQQQYASALGAYDNAIEQPSASEPLRAMVSLHAILCAAETRQWDHSVQIADRVLREFPASPRAVEARCERGLALVELGRLDDAEQDFAAVVANQQGELQVKSELGIGKIQVARKDYDTAVRTFFKVAYGHGGTEAPASFHPWQAEAIYAAANALEVSARPDAARKLYQELIDDYPTSSRTAKAQQSLERILRR